MTRFGVLAAGTDLDPVLSDTKEELSDMAKEEVENMPETQ